MKIDLSKEVPELALVIECSERIDLMEQVMEKLENSRQEAAIKAMEILTEFEVENKVWFGEDLLVEYQGKQYLVKGLNDDEREAIRVSQIQHSITIEDKQTKGIRGTKEQS